MRNESENFLFAPGDESSSVFRKIGRSVGAMLIVAPKAREFLASSKGLLDPPRPRNCPLASENDVFFGPVMDLAAMWAG